VNLSEFVGQLGEASEINNLNKNKQNATNEQYFRDI
jgi:hypothetical protein